MNIRDLIQELSEFDPNTAVMVLDGTNGGGLLRDLNLGPSIRTISQTDADETADCEGRIGEQVISLGYGSY